MSATIARSPPFPFPPLVQVLGVCPLLVGAASLLSGLALGFATLAVLGVVGGVASLVGGRLSPGVRAAVVIVIAAAGVSSLQLTMAAWLTESDSTLVVFVPLIVSSCLLLTCEESRSPRERPRHTMLVAAGIGAGCLLVLPVLGSIRELLGSHTLGAGLAQLVGSHAPTLGSRLHAGDGRGLLVALLPPGAFLLLGVLVAAVNVLRRKPDRKTAGASAPHA